MRVYAPPHKIPDPLGRGVGGDKFAEDIKLYTR